MSGSATAPIVKAADNGIVELWLYGRSPHTQRAYRADVATFLDQVGKRLDHVTLGDLQGYADSLAHLVPTSRYRRLSSVKSLLTFGSRLGLLPVNAGDALKLPSLRSRLAERILPELDVQRLIALEPDERNHTLLRLVYAAGLRVSEVCRLAWRDVQERGDAGQITVFGKGGKTRAVLLSSTTWRELASGRAGAGLEDPVFRSKRSGSHLSESAVWRIVRAAAKRASIGLAVSPHWLRHAHASHALDRGAPIHLVQATLGHASVATTGKYLHARPNDSSARYLAV